MHSTKEHHRFVLSIKFNIYPLNLPSLDDLGRRQGKKRGNMNIENTQSQMRKGILEFCILSIIRRGESYPSDIVEEMKAANKRETDIILGRMKAESTIDAAQITAQTTLTAQQESASDNAVGDK